ncbi:MAG TPA: condensation domain-containing protein, partial [Gemmatimonadota bacterium]|nr:condensation domain-containing protein [Gemmatimonadota bacterium]
MSEDPRSRPPAPRSRSRPERVAPVSQAQRHFWLLDQITGGHPVYNVPRRYRIRGPVDGACLERALGEVARRHEILRTRFPQRGNGPVQEVLPSHPFRLQIVDLSGRTEAERAERLLALEAEAARRPFDLAEGPAWRATLARLSTEDHVLLLALHHVVFDGWSRPLLEEELSACYRAFARGMPPPLDPLPLQYADFAEWERERHSDERLDRLLDWWTERLKDLPVIDLP